MHSQRPLLSLFCLAAIGTCSLQADTTAETFSMRVKEPVMVGKTRLPPGTHLWKLLESRSNRHIVQISDAVTRRVEATILAVPNYRRTATQSNAVQFWETPEGSPKAVRSWFSPGENFGQEFPYAPQLAMYRPMPSTSAKLIGHAGPFRSSIELKANAPNAGTQAGVPLTSSAASQGSWAIITNGASTPKVNGKHPGGLWQTLKNLPLTATLAPLIGLIGIVLLVLYALSHAKHKKGQELTS